LNLKYVLKFFPGINIATIKAIIDSAKGIVIESFGAGNAPTSTELSALLNTANKEGKIMLNITQCLHGSAVDGQYETSEPFGKSGVISGKDMTTEAAIIKLMFLLGQGLSNAEIKEV
jgi:L-asparaginase